MIKSEYKRSKSGGKQNTCEEIAKAYKIIVHNFSIIEKDTEIHQKT